MNTFELLLGTLIYRPYVYAFFLCFLILGGKHLGWKRWLTFSISSYLIAFLCEYSATRNGFPFGYYTYIDDTRTRELWISNIPFWDSLSFVFLSYFSFILAALICTPNRSDAALEKKILGGLTRFRTPFLGGLLMTLLDVVIDPITLQGEKWFLGKIYTYPHHGFYFGVTFANFLGWYFVGVTTQLAFQLFLKFAPWCKDSWKALPPLWIWSVFGTYAGVFLFMEGVTLFVGDFELAAASAVVSSLTLLFIYSKMKKAQ